MHKPHVVPSSNRVLYEKRMRQRSGRILLPGQTSGVPRKIPERTAASA